MRVVLDGTGFDPVTEAQVVAHVRRALERGEGGRIVTPNVDILRQARSSAAVRDLLCGADLVVADGMPLVWASRLARTPVPERVAGSSLIWSLSSGVADDGRSVFLLGGAPDDRATGAERAASRLAVACPGLRIAGCLSPAYGFERRPKELEAVCREVVEAKPDLVYVGLGFPKQEWVISALADYLPFTWFLGCGAAINFVAGDARRAPAWMQRAGLEWLHRLAGEPRRMAGRYLGHDAPYAMRLLVGAMVGRVR
ncbi:WecB/TagA/CpsF family glycosyltransferase [Catenuloplanes atrovinosus]|uniref:N-acetylglucosaminyldiphosphoundecaprenol N-acetyl-beta-D-mannosaminyltransferase n=1 Tax=Catenuloplanes atrovinosus TaxID=137266 RepID=A0AAE3YWT6_9ACTN|nr:WecB/TagA/CpsF family glycosyltransferase [Catenuloplanes atrovinosus]MDR7279336.1 N-acetylglucosaminyldiphosphoundecaprenol N-acetyl-beta-D-mannosaminyltransferase [Catenuloplanes atrovinosus]